MSSYFGTPQGWTNTRLAKTANYTVTNADKGSTIALGGTSYFTLTFNAASVYDSNFMVVVVNEDTSRAKLVSCSGLSSFFLWPGQTIVIFASNNVWRSDRPAKWTYTSAPTIFVDPTNGSDTTTSDGLASGTGAKASITGAYNLATQNFQGNGGTIAIQLADGTYTTANPTFAGGQTGAFLWSVGGASGHSASVIMQKGFSIKDFTAVSFNEITFNSITGSAINVDQSGIADLNTNVVFGSGASMTPASATNNGVLNFNNATFSGGSLNIGFNVSQGGRLNLVAVTISAAVAFGTACAFSNTAGEIDANGASITGAGVAGCTGQRYFALNGGGIDTGGGGANFFPGNSAGSATSPGWYA